jgi:hypothetical protein
MIQGPFNPLAWTTFHQPPVEVVPMNDIREHVPGMRCWCQPEVDDCLVIIHNALDRRDEFMTKRRRPS